MTKRTPYNGEWGKEMARGRAAYEAYQAVIPSRQPKSWWNLPTAEQIAWAEAARAARIAR